MIRPLVISALLLTCVRGEDEPPHDKVQELTPVPATAENLDTAIRRGVDFLVLESNHDDDMLAHGPYPRFLQKRIASRYGHLSNRDAGDFVRRTVGRGLNHLVLAHLSENCNSPAVAMTAMRGAVARTAFKGTITTAAQEAVVGPFMPGESRVHAPMQYSLFG